MRDPLPRFLPLLLSPAAAATIAVHAHRRRQLIQIRAHLRAQHAARIAAELDEESLNEALDELSQRWGIEL